MSGLPSASSHALSNPLQTPSPPSMNGHAQPHHGPNVVPPTPPNNMVPGGNRTSSWNDSHANSGAPDANGKLTVNMTVDLYNSPPYHSGQFQLCFASTNTRGPNAGQRLWGISSLNCNMLKEPWIQKYGREKDYFKVFQDFVFVGVRQTKNQNPNEKLMDGHMAIWFGKQANQVPNIWDNNIREQDHLYIVLRRMKVKDALTELLGEDAQRKRRKINPNSSHFQQLIETAEEEEELRHKGEGRYCWQFVPVLSRRGMTPPKYLYCNNDGVGSYWTVGTAYTIRGQTSDRTDYNVVETKEQSAIKAVYPEGDGTDYIKALMASGLSRLEIQLRLRL
jgi:hypothetical protein